MRFDDAAFLITGSSRGIGAAVANKLAARSARIILHGRHIDQMAPAAAALGAKALAADFSRPDGAEELARSAMTVYGRIDGIVHCAGIGHCGPVADMTPEQIDRLLRVDLLAPIHLTRLLLPSMLAAGRGHVCFITSIAGLTGVAEEAVYSAAKAGLVMFAESIALELAGTGVSASTIAPGAVRTEYWVNRGSPYERRFPKQMSADRVAEEVVRAMDGSKAQVVVPRWLGMAPAVRAVLPGIYRRLAFRFG